MSHGTYHSSASGHSPMTQHRFGVVRHLRVLAQFPDGAAVGGDRLRGELGAGRLIEEGRLHKLIREARHGAADADAADIGATANAVDPAALADVAVDHWSPAP